MMREKEEEEINDACKVSSMKSRPVVYECWCWLAENFPSLFFSYLPILYVALHCNENCIVCLLYFYVTLCSLFDSSRQATSFECDWVRAKESHLKKKKKRKTNVLLKVYFSEVNWFEVKAHEAEHIS